MMIAIDGIFMSNPQPGGYKTYTTNLVRGLCAVGGEHQYLLLTDREITWPPQKNWLIAVQPRRGRWGFVWREQVLLPRLLEKKNVALLHCPGATGPLLISLPIIVTIYDAIEFSQPLPSIRQATYWGMRVYSRLVQKTLAQKSAGIITISNYSKWQITHYFNVCEERVSVVHLAPSEIFIPLNKNDAKEQISSRCNVKDYLLAIASIAPRKNIHTLLRAYALMGKILQYRHPLVLVCTHASVKSELLKLATTLGIENQVVFLEHVSDDELVLLYNAALLFIYPSLEEGFGLPPLEAMACGTPVISSNTSSMPEVLGDAALYITPTDAQQLAEAISKVITTPALAEELSGRGVLRSQAFSWESTARQTLAVYERVATT